jgi:heterodisulfide reductase subunit A
MTQVGSHPYIELLTYSEIEEVSGYIGNFKVKVRKKARYVDEALCTGCGLCQTKCPWKVDSEKGYLYPLPPGSAQYSGH